MRKNDWIHLLFVLLAFIIGFIVYPYLPAQVASHWNLASEVDGYMSRFWGSFLMPIVGLGLWILFLILPRIDPRKKNIEAFRPQFDGLILLLLLYLLYVYFLSLVWNFGWRFDMGQATAPALAVLFYYIGMLMQSSKPNWFIGIRTPWTLSNDRVWAKTHWLGAVLFKLAALVMVLGMFVPGLMIYFVLLPVMIAGIVPVIYSYFIYKQ